MTISSTAVIECTMKEMHCYKFYKLANTYQLNFNELINEEDEKDKQRKPKSKNNNRKRKQIGELTTK